MSGASYLSRSTLGYQIRNLALLSRPSIDISLNGSSESNGSFVNSFTTMDKIEGTVSIRAGSDTRFDDVEIAFLGITKTYVEKMATSPSMAARTEAKHRFLKLTQPIDETLLPQPRIAEGGKTYAFPFTFVIPNQLLPGSCAHSTTSDHLKDAHLQLPPSLGDPDMSASTSGALLDDLAPEMAKILYSINVKVTRTRDGGGPEIVLAEKSKKVQIKPAFEEQPPLSVERNDEYCLRKEKTIRKGLFRGKLGSLVMETIQPRSFRLPPPALDATSSAETTLVPITTMAKVRVRFDPAHESVPPPELGNLSSRLKVSTFYATKPRSAPPTKAALLLDISQGHHSYMLNLSSRCVVSAQWERHDPDSVTSCASSVTETTRRGSDASLAPIPEPSATYSQRKPFYVATLLVPVTLPANKNFVPTFHSCLVSRVYALDLSLSLNGAGIGATSLSVRVPVQVTADRRPGNQEDSSAAIAGEVSAEAAAETEEVFQPRSVVPPAAEFIGTSTEVAAGARGAPPGYEFLASPRVPVCG